MLLPSLHYIEHVFHKFPEDELISKDYLYYGKILLDLKRDSNEISTGIKMLIKAYEADTSDEKLLIELIKTTYENKDYPDAIKFLSKKINNNDNTAHNYMLLGKAFYYNKELS